MGINEPNLMPLGLKQVNTGVVPGDGQGDILYKAFEKVNYNFSRLNNVVLEDLQSDRTYFVSPTGSDSNSGLSADSALATISKAVELSYSVNSRNKAIEIQLADGDYHESVLVSNTTFGSGQRGLVDIFITGNVQDSSKVNWYAGANNDTQRCIIVQRSASVYIKGVTFKADQSFSGNQEFIRAQYKGQVTIGNVIFGLSSSVSSRTVHVCCEDGLVRVMANYTISGSATHHIELSNNSSFFIGTSNDITVNLVGNISFETFVVAYIGSFVQGVRPTFNYIGKATGKKFRRDTTSSVIDRYPFGLTDGQILDVLLGKAFAEYPSLEDQSSRVATTKWTTDKLNLTTQRISNLVDFLNNELIQDTNLNIDTLFSSILPTGTVLPFAANYAPDGFLICEGQEISRSSYSRLFSVISTAYGVGDGNSTFNLPNLSGRTIIGAGHLEGLTRRSVTDTGGSEYVTLSTQHLPQHNHSVSIGDHTHRINDPTHSHSINDPGHDHSVYTDYGDASSGSDNITHAHTASNEPRNWSTSNSLSNVAVNPTFSGISLENSGATTVNSTSVGSGEAHLNMQPWIALRYIIKY